MNIRPHKVVEAANWLVNDGNLYKREGITFNENWHNGDNILLAHDGSDSESEEETGIMNNGKEVSNDDNWSENEAEVPGDVTDTMLTASDFMTDHEREYILNIAPGEGSPPLSVFRDVYPEELAYPGFFLGQKRPDNNSRITDVYYSDICKSELRRSDRRAAMCIKNTFFKTKKLQMKILLGKSFLQPRTQALYSTLLPRLRKDPGSGWSRVSQILGDNNCNSLGLG